MLLFKVLEHQAIQSEDLLDVEESVAIENSAVHDLPSSKPVTRKQTKQRSRSAMREDLPRFLLIWCLWILFSWLTIRKIGGWQLRDVAGGIFSAPGEPVMRWMMLAILMGFMLVWPVYRLSQKPMKDDQGREISQRGIRLLADWLGMFLLFQVVLWPVLHMSKWSVDQGIYLNIMIGGWSLITGFIIDWGLRFSNAARRSWAMAICAALVFLEPVVMVIINTLGWQISWPLSISPLGVFGNLTVASYNLNLAPLVWHIDAAVVVAIIGWVVTLSLHKKNT